MNWTQFLRDAALGTTAYMSMKTAKGIESLNAAFGEYQKRSEAQLESIRADIKRGFASMSLELAVHSEIFKNILNVLQNKRKTEAEELKQFGLTALRNDWIDDAIRDFDKSLEINRYDYQVYYLLAKCYYFKGDAELQNKNLELAYHYAAEDASFRLYIALDIVASLVEEQKYDEAKHVIGIVEDTIGEDVDNSPLLLAKIYIDVCTSSVDNSTLNAISQALENYQGDDPSKIMTIILALSQQCNNETRARIENLFNLKKLQITQKYGKKVVTYFSNIGKFLAFTEQVGSVTNANLTSAPAAVKKRFFPAYSSISDLRKRIQSIIDDKSALSVEQFDKFVFLMPALYSLENSIIEDVRWANEPAPPFSSFNKNPYTQISEPNLNFKVDSNDKILLQLELGGALLTLTIFKLIIVDSDKKTYQYDIYDDYLNLPIQELNRAPRLGLDEEPISFYIRDRISDKVIQVATSKQCSSTYSINDSRANYLDLFTQRATSLLRGYLSMSLFNGHLELLSAYLDMLGVEAKDSPVKAIKDTPVVNQPVSDMNDVEFLD